MKIAIGSDGDLVTNAVTHQFEQSKYFILHDTDTKIFDNQSIWKEILDNKSNVENEQVDDTRTAEQLSNLGVKYIITGVCGQNADKALRACGIQVITGAVGTVLDAIKKFKRNILCH